MSDIIGTFVSCITVMLVDAEQPLSPRVIVTIYVPPVVIVIFGVASLVLHAIISFAPAPFAESVIEVTTQVICGLLEAIVGTGSRRLSVTTLCSVAVQPFVGFVIVTT